PPFDGRAKHRQQLRDDLIVLGPLARDLPVTRDERSRRYGDRVDRISRPKISHASVDARDAISSPSAGPRVTSVTAHPSHGPRHSLLSGSEARVGADLQEPTAPTAARQPSGVRAPPARRRRTPPRASVG